MIIGEEVQVGVIVVVEETRESFQKEINKAIKEGFTPKWETSTMVACRNYAGRIERTYSIMLVTEEIG